jgi:Zn-dependent M28 family amino/carboxypeptidase
VFSSSGETHSCLDLDINRDGVNIITVSEKPWKPVSPHTFTFNLTAPDPFIESVLNAVKPTRMQQYISTLSAYHSRQSQSQGAYDAQRYLATTYSQKGFVVTTYRFRTDMSENVIAEIRGTRYPDQIVCVGAHYDSRSTNSNSPDLRAPGADDNASGSSNLLEFATVIAEQNVRFEKTLRLLSFSGEEQGLLGSRAYARHLASIGENVIAMFNGDMLGWKLPSTPITIGMKDRYIDTSLLAAVNDITRTYVPTLPVGSSASCCSDHQSFTEAGFSAVGYFENPGGASDYPHYHKSTDLPEYINVQQLGLEGKAIMAAALTYAGAYRGTD